MLFRSLQDPARYEAEKRLFDAIDNSLPVLGICYGCQFLNVARGGSLHQHLPDIYGHNKHSEGDAEPIAVKGGTKLFQISGEAVEGRSFHHQAINRLGSSLRVTATAQDGTVEAIEAADRDWEVAVQWHPERSPNDPQNKAIFDAFVTAASRYAEAKRR